MPQNDIITVRDEIIRALEEMNALLSQKYSVKHPHYQELKYKYYGLKEKMALLQKRNP